MHTAKVPLIISVLHFYYFYTVNGCSSKPNIDFFTLRNRATRSCVDVSWYQNFEGVVKQRITLKPNYRCDGRGNQQFRLKDGRLQFFCRTLGARQVRDGERIVLVPMGNEDELNWTLDADGGVHVTNTTLRIANFGKTLILLEETLEQSQWRLEKVTPKRLYKFCIRSGGIHEVCEEVRRHYGC